MLILNKTWKSSWEYSKVKNNGLNDDVDPMLIQLASLSEQAPFESASVAPALMGA